MKFRTSISSSPRQWRVQYGQQITLLGSCFAASIGERFAKAKISAVLNPWGTLYHPKAILTNLKRAIGRNQLPKEGVVALGQRYTHFDVHSDISSPTVADLYHLYTSVNEGFIHHLQSTHILFLTLGTSWHFRYIESDQIVANCHKQPNHLFDRKLSTPQEVYDDLSDILRLTREIQPDITVVITVSPVRHIRDGLIANNRSKAHLLCAVHDICDRDKQVHYFPSYEMLIDDLRDYRFYAKDLVHPSDLAVDYIWDYIVEHHMLPADQNLITQTQSIQKQLYHRPVDPGSIEHKKFLSRLIDRMKHLQHEHNINYTKEIMTTLSSLDAL